MLARISTSGLYESGQLGWKCSLPAVMAVEGVGVGVEVLTCACPMANRLQLCSERLCALHDTMSARDRSLLPPGTSHARSIYHADELRIVPCSGCLLADVERALHFEQLSGAYIA